MGTLSPTPCKPFEKGLTLNFIAENCVFRGLKHKEILLYLSRKTMFCGKRVKG